MNQKIRISLVALFGFFLVIALGVAVREKKQNSEFQPTGMPKITSEREQERSSKQSQSTEQAADLSEIQKQLDTLDSENGNIIYTAISAKDFNLERGEYTIEENRLRYHPEEYYVRYTNKNLGISFAYLGSSKSYIKEISPGKLQYVEYDSKSDSYKPNPQDYIEIYAKRDSDTLEEAVKKMITQKGAKIEKCELKDRGYKNGQALVVTYYKPFAYDKSKCPSNSYDLTCSHDQGDEYEKIASGSCSTFEESLFYNYFVYQPENTTNKIAFIRHVFGLDGPISWNYDTIRLFN